MKLLHWRNMLLSSFNLFSIGDVAQLAEHENHSLGVDGSSPFITTSNLGALGHCSFCPLPLDLCPSPPLASGGATGVSPSGPPATPERSDGWRVRRWVLVPVIAGSNPATSAKRQRLLAAYGVQAACPSRTLNLIHAAEQRVSSPARYHSG